MQSPTSIPINKQTLIFNNTKGRNV